MLYLWTPSASTSANQVSCRFALFFSPHFSSTAVLKNLRAITLGLSDKDSRTAVGVSGVETQCRLLVKQLLDRFRAAVRANDVMSMQLFAASLFDFDGGDSCVEVYLHEAFARSAPPLKWTEAMTLEAAQALVRKFFVHVGGQLEQQYATIAAVFPEPPAVLTSVLEKIFEWADVPGTDSFPLSVRATLKRIQTAAAGDGEKYLVLLADVYVRTQQLVGQLSQLPLEAGLDLQRLVDYVFSAARDAYLESELLVQERLYTARLASFRGLLSPLWLEQERAKATVLPWEEMSLDKTRQMSLDDVELTKFFLHHNRTAVERCVKLSHRKDVPGNVTALYKLLLRVLGHACVARAVDLHVDMVPDRPAVKKPLGQSFLYVTLAVNTVVLDVEQYHHSVVLPAVSASINEPTKCNSMKAKLVLQLEHKLAQGLQKLVRVMAAYAGALLDARQKRLDYRPAPTAPVRSPTAACVSTCEFLDAQYQAVTSCLDGGNADAFLRRLGTLFYDALFVHLTKYSVTMGTGGTQLMLDLSRYGESISVCGDDV